jgi:hypothetical protein
MFLEVKKKYIKNLMNRIQWKITSDILIPIHINKKFGKANVAWYNPYNQAMR